MTTVSNLKKKMITIITVLNESTTSVAFCMKQLFCVFPETVCSFLHLHPSFFQLSISFHFFVDTQYYAERLMSLPLTKVFVITLLVALIIASAVVWFTRSNGETSSHVPKLAHATGCLRREKYVQDLRKRIQELEDSNDKLKMSLAHQQQTSTQHSRPHCDYIQNDWYKDYDRELHSSDRQIILGAGPGTTATRTVAELVANILGRPVGHWKKVYVPGGTISAAEEATLEDEWMNAFFYGEYSLVGHLTQKEPETFDYARAVHKIWGLFDVQTVAFPVLFSCVSAS